MPSGPSCWWTAVRASSTAGWMSVHSAATSMSFRAISSMLRPGRESCTVGANCSSGCLLSWAAAIWSGRCGSPVPRSPTCRSSSRPERPIMSVPSVSAKRWNISGKSAWTESRSTNIAWRSMPPTDCPPWRGCVSTVRRRISAASFHSMRKGCMLTIWE